MITEVLNVSDKAIALAVKILGDGGIVAFPTETVYGLGADAFNAEAAKKVFLAKGRPSDNPFIVHCADKKMIESVCLLNETAVKLIDAFMPAPLTLVLPKDDKIPREVTAGLNTVAVRIPDNLDALRLIRAFKRPLAAPSANSSGRPSPTEAGHVYEDLNGKIPLILDGGACKVGLESTVLDVTDPNNPIILREGGISRKQIEEALLKNVGVKTKLESGSAPKSPGMKYRHYAPSCMVLTLPNNESSFALISGKYAECMQKGKKPAIITAEDELPLFKEKVVFSYGKTQEDAARNIFRLFRQLEKDYDVLIVKELRDTGIGRAFNDRIGKASQKEGGI